MIKLAAFFAVLCHGCGGAPDYVTDQGVAVYFEHNPTHVEAHPELLSVTMALANHRILEWMGVDLADFEYGLPLTVTGRVDDTTALCGQRAHGCYSPDGGYMVMLDEAPCDFDVLGHELIHMARVLRDNAMDYNHPAPYFGGCPGTLECAISDALYPFCKAVGLFND